MVNTATTALDIDNRKQRYTMPSSRSPLTRVLSLIDCPQSSIRFLILDCPTESTLDFYIEQFEQLNVTTVVRCCQPTYNAERVKSHNIGVKDLPFKDGGTVSGCYYMGDSLKLIFCNSLRQMWYVLG